MTMMEAMRARHSVRSYVDRPLEADTVNILEEEISICNREGNLHIQLVKDEPEAFGGFMARYGKFSGVKNYIALADYYDTTTDYILGRTNQRGGIHGRKPQNQG